MMPQLRILLSTNKMATNLKFVPRDLYYPRGTVKSSKMKLCFVVNGIILIIEYTLNNYTPSVRAAYGFYCHCHIKVKSKGMLLTAYGKVVRYSFC